VKPWTPISRSKLCKTHDRTAWSCRGARGIERLERPLWRARAPHSDANDAIMAVPIEMFVQASSRSVGVRLNRAAQEIGIAIRPSAGRPPFFEIDSASASTSPEDDRSSWVAKET